MSSQRGPCFALGTASQNTHSLKCKCLLSPGTRQKRCEVNTDLPRASPPPPASPCRDREESSALPGIAAPGMGWAGGGAHSPGTPPAPGRGLALLWGRLQGQGGARYLPAEHPARSLHRQARGEQPWPRGQQGSEPMGQQDHPSCRGTGFAQLLVLKKSPQKASVLPVTCQCHTRPLQRTPGGHKAFSG